MQEAAAEYKEVLSQYDLEFEEKGQLMSDKLQKVCCKHRVQSCPSKNTDFSSLPPVMKITVPHSSTELSLSL